MSEINNEKIAEKLPLNEVLPKYIDYRKGYGNLDYAVSPFSGSDNFNHLRINKSKNLWYDYAMGFGGTAINFIMHYKKLSYKESINFLLSEFSEYFNGTKKLKKTQTAKKQKEEIIADDQTRDFAYRTFIKFFKIKKTDLENLIKDRKLSKEQIIKEKFFTFPVANELNVLNFNSYLRREKIELSNFYYVPGFSINKEKQLVWMSVDGLGLPIFNPKNQIIGVQIRLRHGDVGRYLWFSSQGKTYGAGSGSVIANFNAGFGKSLIITEGVFKAIKLQEAFNTQVLALPGVTNTRNLDKNVAWFLKAKNLLKEDPKEFVIVFDSDFQKNKQVTNAINKLASQLVKYKLPIKLLYWKYQKDIKGFDDLVNQYPNSYQKKLKSIFMDKKSNQKSVSHKK